jgi:methionyl-tRNA formyltransferase
VTRRVLLIGQGPTAQSALESLVARFEVVALVRGISGETLDPVIASAVRRGVEVLTDTSVAAIQAAIRDLTPDCVVVSSYDRILPPALLERCPFINVHYAPLPEYRGRATVNWAILNRRADTAITVHVLVPELDAGPILFQERLPIGRDDTVTDLYASLNELQRVHLASAVERHLAGDAGVSQEEAAATYTCARVPADGEIDWSDRTEDVYALVRALTDPFPGAFTYLEARRLGIWRAAPVDAPHRWAGRVPGRVVARSADEGWVDVLTGDGVLRLETVQLEGGRRDAAADVIRSVRATLGLRATDLLEHLRALEERVEPASRLQQHDDPGDDREDADPAPQRDALAQEQLPDQGDQHVAEAVERDDLREILAAVQVKAHEQDDQDQRATSPEAPLHDEAPELTDGHRAAQPEAAHLHERRSHEVQAAQPGGDRCQHQDQSPHHASQPTA